MKQISDKQLEANRLNAKKGGVKTEEGKQFVKFNARKHGILGDLVAEYENNFYENYLEQLFDEIQPKSLIENILVERIALHYLKLFRLAKAESEFMQTCLQPTKDIGDTFFSIGHIGYVPIVNQEHVRQLLEIYCRYETAIENRLYRTIRELKAYKQSPI